MTTPIEIANLIARTAPSADIDERPEILVLRSSLVDAALRAAWISVRRECPAFLEGVTISDADGDSEFDDSRVPSGTEKFRITLRKTVARDELCLFFPQSLQAMEEQFEKASEVFVAKMSGDEVFATHLNRFNVWGVNPAPAFVSCEALSDPRKYCTDLTGTSVVCSDIRPWLLKARPIANGQVFDVWKIMASRRLMAAIADQVSGSGSQPMYHFNGPPKRAFELTGFQVTNLFERLTEGATWVFSEGRDTEARHLLLASEWARSFRSEAIQEIGAGAISSARSAYDAYVKSGSRETLKALAELRKAVVDESQKVAQRANDLAGAMWKDLAVAVVPFAVKLLPDPTKPSPYSNIVGYIAAAAAFFLAFSLAIQIFINRWYFKHQGDARVIWQQALNTVLSQAEIDQFSEQPIVKAVRDYKRVRFMVGIIYAALFVVLVCFAVENFEDSPAPIGKMPSTAVRSPPPKLTAPRAP